MIIFIAPTAATRSKQTLVLPRRAVYAGIADQYGRTLGVTVARGFTLASVPHLEQTNDNRALVGAKRRDKRQLHAVGRQRILRIYRTLAFEFRAAK